MDWAGGDLVMKALIHLEETGSREMIHMDQTHVKEMATDPTHQAGAASPMTVQPEETDRASAVQAMTAHITLERMGKADAKVTAADPMG